MSKVPEDNVISHDPNGPAHGDNDFHKKWLSDLIFNASKDDENVIRIGNYNMQTVPACHCKRTMEKKMVQIFFKAKETENTIIIREMHVLSFQ